MNTFYQSILKNSPVLIALFVLFYLIKLQGFKMEQGFKNVEHEFKLVRNEMREGFLKFNTHLQQHDREIKRIKKKLRSKH
jgi:hypothetical protein